MELFVLIWVLRHSVGLFCSESPLFMCKIINSCFETGNANGPTREETVVCSTSGGAAALGGTAVTHLSRAEERPPLFSFGRSKNSHQASADIDEWTVNF